MTTPLVYALLAGVLLIAVVLGIRRVRRKPAARRPAVSTTTAAKRRSATAGKPRPAPEPARHDAGNTDGPSGGMQVDEIHFGDDDDLLSTGERHIGDTQPMDSEQVEALTGRKPRGGPGSGSR